MPVAVHPGVPSARESALEPHIPRQASETQYSLIIAHGPGTNGPQWFEVRRKDGLVDEYGNTPDSNLAGTGGTRVWALNKIHDRAQGLSSGNYIAFNYFNDQVSSPSSACPQTRAVNNYRLCTITYAGNTTQGTVPPYTINFSYQSRNAGEVLTHYYVGQQITEVNRLAQIQLLYGATVVHSWTLGYDPTATPTHASRITTVQECGENNDCFPASNFTWSTQAFTAGGVPVVTPTGNSDAFGQQAGPSYPGACYGSVSLDIDGDGVPDSVLSNCTSSPNTLTLFWGTPKGQTPRPPVDLSGYLVPGTIYGSMSSPGGTADALGEGKQGLFFIGMCPTQQACWAHVPAGGTTPVVEPAPAATYGASSADLDGDGFPDSVGFPQNNSTIYVSLHNHDGSAGFSPSQAVWSPPPGMTLAASPSYVAIPIGNQVLAADFDGDGRQDILLQTSTGWLVLYSTGTGFVQGPLFTPQSIFNAPQAFEAPVLIDINGDGCTDLAYPSPQQKWVLQISKCVQGASGFTEVDTNITSVPTTDGQTPVSAVDINGDGYQDLVFNGTVAYSNGTGLLTPIQIGWSLWADRDGDGLPDQMAGPSAFTYSSAAGPKSDLMLSAQDGFGNTVNFTYAPLTDSSVYTRGQGQAGVTQDMSGPLYVVKQLQSTDGVGGQYQLGYSYSAAQRNVQGRGFLGFHTRTITDSRNGSVTTETYNNTVNSDGSSWELVGTLAERTVQQWAGGPVLSDTVNVWNSIAPDGAANRRYPYLMTQTVRSYELYNGGTPISTKNTTTTIDNYGTPYDVVVKTTENSTGIHSGTYLAKETYSPAVLNDTVNWCLSKPTTTNVGSQHTLPDGGQIIQSVSQSWDAPHCRLTDKNLDVGSSWELDTHYDYNDGWNNVTDQVVKATNLPQTQRVTSFDYQTSSPIPGQLLMRVTNALSQVTTVGWDPALGERTSVTDPNGFVSSWQYDDFGRPVHQVRPDGTGTRHTYSACNAGTNYCGDGLLRYMVQSDERDVNDQVVSYQYAFYDSLGRAKYEETLGFSGALSVVETLYDPLGNVASRSNPYYAGTDRYQGTSYAYDFYHRVTQAQHPTSDADPTLATTTTTYTGLTITVTDALGHASTQVSDAWGDVVRVIDAGGNNTNYTFDALSNLKSTTDAKGNIATVSYTDRGFKLSSSDPDTGSWSYGYDGAGELLSQTDAKNQQTLFHYDALGRMDNRTDPGAGSPDSIWSWDSAANGIGQLGSVTGTNGYLEQYSYGASGTVAAGKLTATQTTAAGVTYAVNYGFDATLGKPLTVTYPASTSGRLEVLYDYQNGYLKDVKDYTNQVAGAVYWQATAQDARGHVIQEQYGNGQQSYLYFDDTNGRLNTIETGPGGGSATQNLAYSWDQVGNLLTRADANQGLTEAFGYDPLDRLTSVSLNGTATLSVGYDAIGNISSKSDLGTYDYVTQQAGCSYAGLTAQPHAVRNAGGSAYCYDADGNMVSRSGASVSWYPFNYPLTINQAGGNTSTFYYAPDRSRYRQVSLNGSTSEDRTYVGGGLFEKLSSSVEGVVYRHMIRAGDKTVAVRVLSATRNDTYYTHDDHLGSTGAVTDQTGAVQIQESFDAWGKRRGSAWTGAPSAADVAAITKATHRGFTSQEELDNLSLVDLNGRVYDPTVARFMSADPVVQAPFDSQSLNRYSYTFDNPLNATDPTGFAACTGSHINFEVGAACPDGDFSAHKTSYEVGAPQSSYLGFVTAFYHAVDAAVQSNQISEKTLPDAQQRKDGAPNPGDSGQPDNSEDQGTGGGLVPTAAHEGTDKPRGQTGVQDVAGLVALRALLEKALSEAANGNDRLRTYITYVLYNADKNRVYVGRSSGFGSPEEIAARRYSGHMLLRLEGYKLVGFDKAGFGMDSAGRESIAYKQIRGREQLDLEAYGFGREPPGIDYTRNLINAISPLNLNGPAYRAMAIEEWGQVPSVVPPQMPQGFGQR